MIRATPRLTLAPRTALLAMLAVPTAVFAGLIALVETRLDLSIEGQMSLIAAGLALYAAAVALLLRMGFSGIARLEAAGMTDNLCGLPNRRAFHRVIQERPGQSGEWAVALIDLDGFKLVNDLYGHAVGDQLICAAAEVIEQSCGAEAHCFRLGGDEFAMALSGPLANTILEGLCRGLLTRLATPFAISERRIAIGASIGLAHCDGTAPVGSSELLRRADVAMSAAKRDGKMRCTWYKTEFDRNLAALRTMEEDLRSALLNRELAVHYQPLVDASTLEVVAVEALVRWQRPDGNAVGPHLFIPVAEETGLIHAIGLFVLRQSCRDGAGWPAIRLSVNISAAQLRNPEFPIQLGQILEETGFPPERLELEITETCLVLDPKVAERSLDLIRSFGVKVVLDDFGTGYASIGFLRRFRFNKLKLDRSLVVESATDEASRAMMLSTISMAQALQMGVTAEGVETEAQAELVRAAGCDQIQGWLYFKAMPAPQLDEVLRRTTPPAGKAAAA